jgi:hypothetical protein
MRICATLTFAALLLLAQSSLFAATTQPDVELWGVFETSLPGLSTGNPFTDVNLSARFIRGTMVVAVNGFYDGDGTYRVRFMPSALGDWQFVTQSNVPELSGKTGSFSCIKPTGPNHGPVRVANTYHFAYADGTPYSCFGTTCYAWAHEPESIQEQTLQTFKTGPFNKVRMLVLPGEHAPLFYPYPRDSAGHFDKTRFNPDFFRHMEKRIAQLGDEGVEADLILFHPYHKGEMQWFDDLDVAADDAYLHYVIARFASLRNVWWSLGNEYNQVKHRTEADWDHFFQLVQADDPYGHLRSIHNGARFYDYNKPWVTHASIQNGSAVSDFGRAMLYRQLVRKPIVYDEVCYEGHIPARWGHLTGEEMTLRFWMGTIGGTYVGHGETLPDPGAWSATGGTPPSAKPDAQHTTGAVAWVGGGDKLLGQSPARIAFLRKIVESGPPDGIEPIDQYYDANIGGKAGEFYLVYFGHETPTSWPFVLPRDPPNKTALTEGMKFHVDVLDTWNMTITPLDQVFTTGKPVAEQYPEAGNAVVKLPGKPYIALRITRMN